MSTYEISHYTEHMDEEPKDEKYKINGPVALSLHVRVNGDALELRKSTGYF